MKICGHDFTPMPSLHLQTEKEAGKATSTFAAALRHDGELNIT